MDYRGFPINGNNEIERKSLLEQYKDEGSFYELEENNSIRPFKPPKFIIEEKNCCNNFLRIFCCKSKNKIITQNELKAYYKLREIALIPYEKNNIDHENSLKNLFISSLNCDLTDNLETVEWKGLGFQVYCILFIKKIKKN